MKKAKHQSPKNKTVIIKCGDGTNKKTLKARTFQTFKLVKKSGSDLKASVSSINKKSVFPELYRTTEHHFFPKLVPY